MRGESFKNGKIQFSLVYAEGRSWKDNQIVLRALPNKLSSSRFGFVVSRRVGKAVVRNHIKRLLREIVRQTQIKPGWDVVFIARIPAASSGFEGLGKSVRWLLNQAGLCGGNESISTGDD